MKQDPASIAERLQAVHRRIAAACERVGTAVFGSRSTPDSYYWPEGTA